MTHDFSPGYVRYALGLIFLVAVFNTCDRTILSVLVPEIRADLGLSDRDLGILMGPAFAVVHIVAGLPIARLADRTSRRTVIAVGLFAWSLLTMAQGLARSFPQLLAARMGVGIGEAAGSPPSHSLLCDYAPVSMRARALSVLQVGSVCGMGLGMVFGGWVNEIWGWRAAFISVGVPGIVLAAVVLLTLREPPRGATEGIADRVAGDEVRESALGAALHLLRTPTYAWMLIGVCAFGVVGIGRTAWEPTFLREVWFATRWPGGCARAGMGAVEAEHRTLVEERNGFVGCSVNLDRCRAPHEPHARRWDYVLAFHSDPMKDVGVEVHHAAADEVAAVVSKRDWAQALLASECPEFEVLAWSWLIPAGSQAFFLPNSPEARTLAEAGVPFPKERLIL